MINHGPYDILRFPSDKPMMIRLIRKMLTIKTVMRPELILRLMVMTCDDM